MKKEKIYINGKIIDNKLIKAVWFQRQWYLDWGLRGSSKVKEGFNPTVTVQCVQFELS